MEPFEAAPDLVGRTSARLVAAGVDRHERLDALHLLAILDASTDLDGRVRRPLDDLADEFDLHPLQVIRSLEHLEDAGAVAREDGRLRLLGDGEAIGGMHLADFLDDVRASFAADDAPLAEPVPLASRTSRWLSRAGAGLVAVAAAAAVVALAPGTTPTSVQPLASGSPSTAAPTTTEPMPDSDTGDRVLPSTTMGTSAPVTDTDVTAPPVVDTTVVAATCPAGEPFAEVIDDIVRITNPFDHDIAVTALTVGGITISSPITVVAGGYADWPVIATLTADEPAIGAWEYIDPSVARTCPS